MFVLSHLIFLSKDFFIQYIIIILARKKKGEEFHSAALAVRIHVKTKKRRKRKTGLYLVRSANSTRDPALSSLFTGENGGWSLFTTHNILLAGLPAKISH